MALALYDRVQETTTTTGTGTITLDGAVSGYQSFAVVGNGNTCYYTIVNNSAWEVGIGTYSTTGPTLARTIVLSNSNANTSPITLSGSSSVFLTYPAEKSVNLDASGNVSPLGTISSGTWQGSTVGVAYGGTGVTASSGVNSVVLRDSNANVVFNNFTAGATAVTAAAGTTVLTVASPRTQILVGSTTQTFQLPNATTVGLGQSFIFINNSSGLLTVKDNSGATVETVPSGGITQLGALSIATSAGTWGAYSFVPAAVDWGTNALNLATTVISGGTWQGGTIQPGYGGTGLTTFVAANNALYSSGASTLTAGTLPIAAGGTGITSLTSGYIPYGNGTSALSSSSALQFNGTYLVVGGTTPLGGATNPITAFSSTANNYVQTYVYNASNGTSASADFVAYSDNSTDAHGWADMGFTSSTYADPTYTVTGPNEAYILGSAPSGAGATGNLVYATDFTGSANAHQWYVGGFTQLKSAWKMQLTSTGLQLANALGTAYGGTGRTSFTANGVVYASSTSALATGSGLQFDGTNLLIGSSSINYAKLSVLGAASDPSLTVGTAATAVIAGATGQELAITESGSTPYTISLQGRNSTGGPSGTSYPIALNPLGGNLSVGTTTATGKVNVLANGTTFTPQSSNSLGGSNTTRFHIFGSEPFLNICSDTNGSAQTGTATINMGMGIGVYTSSDIRSQIYWSNTPLTFAYTATPTGTPTEYMRITTAGGVAFNGATNYGTSGQYLKSNGNAPPTWSSVSAAPAGSDTQVQYNSAGAFAGSANLTFNGTNLTCGGTVTANSDETLKTNWRDLPADFIEQLAKVKHGTYDRVDIELTQDGVGAQSLQPLMPNSVLKGEDGKLSVAYGNAALVAAIALAERVVELEARLAALEK